MEQGGDWPGVGQGVGGGLVDLDVHERLIEIETHIRQHVQKLRRVQ